MAGGGTNYDLDLGLHTGNLERNVTLATRAVRELGTTSDRTQGRLTATSSSSQRLATSSSAVARSQTAAATSSNAWAASSSRLNGVLGSQLRQLVAVGAAWLSIAGVIRQLGGASRGFGETETALVGVAKTTGIVGAELRGLYDDIVELSTGPVPVLTGQLLEIAQVAGQLGVQGSSNILAYVETLGKLTAATDVIGEEGAASITRLMNVQGEGPQNIRALGSALVALGNDAAATESQILDVGTEVGLATAQFRIGSVAAIAWGTALKESGVEAEAGGTAIGRVYRSIQKAVAEGGEELQKFANVAGVSADELAAAWEGNATEAVLLFFKGLSEFGQDSSLVLADLGLGSDRLAKVLPTLASNYDRLALRQRQAADEAQRMTALEKEATAAFDTQDSDLQRLANTYRAVRDEVGRGMSPALRQLTEDLQLFLTGSEESAVALGQDLGGALETVGELLIFFLHNLDVAIAGLQAFALVKVAVMLAGFVGWLGRATVALGAYTTATATATGATLFFNAATTRVSPILDQYGKNIIVAQKGTSSFLSTAIRPTTVGLGALLGVLLLLNERVTDFGDRMERETRRIAGAMNDFSRQLDDVRKRSRDLVSQAALDAEVAKELLAAGIKDPAGEAALRVRQRVEADFQRQRVDALGEYGGALDAAREKLVAERAELERLINVQRAMESTIGRRGGATSVLGGIPAAPDPQVESGLGRVRERIAEVQSAANMSEVQVRALERAIDDL
ncbi:MAG TPA: phage tail tape measure protein, partial [Actinobacteria bacterium]|nr:phage tail tape measure protein [Actinomycetota bacterium]